MLIKEEIIEYASRYVDEDDIVDFPEEGDLFCFFHRELPDDKVLEDDEGWQFGGYGRIEEYELDMSAKPVGKWINMHFTSLAMFPPQLREMRLQPPHIALGMFTDPSKTIQTKIVNVEEEDEFEDENDSEPTIMQFPGKK